MEASDKSELITEVSKQRLAENIKALGEPEKDMITGHFTFEYYSQVFRLIQKYAKESFAPRRKEYLAQRRAFMKAGRRQEYQDILNEMVSEEEIIATKLLTATFIETFGMTEEQLIQTHMHYMSDSKCQSILMQCMEMPNLPETVSINKEKAIEVFLEQETHRFATLKPLKQNQHKFPNEETFMQAMLVQQALVVDYTKEKHGVEEDEMAAALVRFEIMKDPVVQVKMREIMLENGAGVPQQQPPKK